jgi:phospholipase/carboxylesterase
MILIILLSAIIVMDSEAFETGLTMTKRGEDIILTPTGEHKYSLIWLHGLGDTAEGFLDFFYSKNTVVPN